MPEEQELRAPTGGQRRIGDPLVRAVARAPVTVRTKLLIAFVGTSLLLVAVGLLGQRVIGQSNDRVGSFGALQRRTIAYGQLELAVRQVRELLSENAGPAYGYVWNDPGRKSSRKVDRLVVNAVVRVESGTAADQLGFTPPEEDVDDLDDIHDTADRLETLMEEELIPFYRYDGEPTQEMLATRAHAEQLSSDLKRFAAVLTNGLEDDVERSDRPERQLLRQLPGTVPRRRGGSDRPRVVAGVRPVVVADRTDPADRHSAGRGRIR